MQIHLQAATTIFGYDKQMILIAQDNNFGHVENYLVLGGSLVFVTLPEESLPNKASRP